MLQARKEALLARKKREELQFAILRHSTDDEVRLEPTLPEVSNPNAPTSPTPERPAPSADLDAIAIGSDESIDVRVQDLIAAPSGVDELLDTTAAKKTKAAPIDDNVMGSLTARFGAEDGRTASTTERAEDANVGGPTDISSSSSSAALGSYAASAGAMPSGPSSASVGAPSGSAQQQPVPRAPLSKRKTLKKSKAMAAMAAASGVLRLPSAAANSHGPPTPDQAGASAAEQAPSKPTGSQAPAVPLPVAGPGTATPPSAATSPSPVPTPPEAGGPGAADSRAAGVAAGPSSPADSTGVKTIFIVSDCTGESAARTVRAALGQFEAWGRRSMPASLAVFRFLADEQKVRHLRRPLSVTWGQQLASCLRWLGCP